MIGAEADDRGGVNLASSVRTLSLCEGDDEWVCNINWWPTFSGTSRHTGADASAAAAVLLWRLARHDAKAAKKDIAVTGVLFGERASGHLLAMPARACSDYAIHEDV
jgi:hypothetical protein